MSSRVRRGPVTGLALLAAVLATGPAPARAQERTDRWEPAIRAFEARDAKDPPPRHGVLFVGSSSIRGWDLPRWFPERRVINRGFGGSQIADSVRFLDRIVLRHRPRVVVLYAGDNDIAAGKSPEAVAADFATFAAKVHRALPETRILFVAIKPSIARFRLAPQMRAANRRIKQQIGEAPHMGYVDIDAPMIGADGRPRRELFVADGLHLSDAGYELWSGLVEAELKLADRAREGRLRIATCQFPVGADPAANGEWIRRQMETAYREGADLAHFSECALSGYAGVDHGSLRDFDWAAQRRQMESILALAKQRRLWVVLGAAHRLEAAKPHDSLYVISAAGAVVDRYDKRFCTEGDLSHYSPGDHFVTFEVHGVRCGALICYDIRFPELYRRYRELGVDVVFHSFYNARQRPGSIHPKIMPATAQARAATNHVFVSVNNSCAPHSWASLFVTPDGLIGERLALDQPGVMVNLADTKQRFYDASGPFRLDAIRGKLNSGETVEDPRSRDRTGY